MKKVSILSHLNQVAFKGDFMIYTKINSLILLMITALFCISGNFAFAGQKELDSKVTFTVQWYDVGKAALEGLQGVHKVEKSFRGSKEINTVYFDPDLITIEKMQDVLKEAGTYVGIFEAEK